MKIEDGELAVLDENEAVILVNASMDGKAFIKRQSRGGYKYEVVDLERITVIPDKGSVSLKELNDIHFRKETSDED